MTQTAPAPLLSWFDIPYGTDAPDVQRVDVLLPAHAAPDHPLPVVIRIDGCGGWQRGTRWTAMAPFSSPHLAQHGFATVSASIRTSERAIWPAQLEDVLAVTDWVRANPLRLPISPARLGIWGQSAGGHLAAMTALTEGSGIRAVATIGGPADFLDPAMAHLTANAPRSPTWSAAPAPPTATP